MNKLLIKQILLDQKQEIGKIIQGKIIEREIESKCRNWLANNLIKVIIGARRCGKSVLAHQILKGKNYGYINFDDERLLGLKTEQLNMLLETLLEINPPFTYLLLDEVQNIIGWELFVNRLQRNQYNIIITGSNSKLLSQELATHLTGRHLTLELFPFSFREFLNYQDFNYKKNDFYLTAGRARLKQLFNEYAALGGLPEIFKIAEKKLYLKELFDKIINRDIVSRYHLKYVKELKEIALYLISNYSARSSYHKLKNIFQIKSVHTIKNYLNYLEAAYLILPVGFVALTLFKR